MNVDPFFLEKSFKLILKDLAGSHGGSSDEMKLMGQVKFAWGEGKGRAWMLEGSDGEEDDEKEEEEEEKERRKDISRRRRREEKKDGS